MESPIGITKKRKSSPEIPPCPNPLGEGRESTNASSSSASTPEPITSLETRSPGNLVDKIVKRSGEDALSSTIPNREPGEGLNSQKRYPIRERRSVHRGKGWIDLSKIYFTSTGIAKRRKKPSERLKPRAIAEVGAGLDVPSNSAIINDVSSTSTEEVESGDTTRSERQNLKQSTRPESVQLPPLYPVQPAHTQSNSLQSKQSNRPPVGPASEGAPKVSIMPKPTVEVEFWIIKARTPLLDIERWWEGKFQGQALSFVVEGVANITQHDRIEKIKCTLETTEKHCTMVIRKNGDNAFEALKRSFREEMRMAFNKDCNRMKPFRILIEPIYAEVSSDDGELENQGVVMGDW